MKVSNESKKPHGGGGITIKIRKNIKNKTINYFFHSRGDKMKK